MSGLYVSWSGKGLNEGCLETGGQRMKKIEKGIDWSVRQNFVLFILLYLPLLFTFVYSIYDLQAPVMPLIPTDKHSRPWCKWPTAALSRHNS